MIPLKGTPGPPEALDLSEPQYPFLPPEVIVFPALETLGEVSGVWLALLAVQGGPVR